MKPRLCRSYWRAFASTHPLMLLPLLERLSLLALPHLLGACLPSLSSPLFPLHAPALMRLSLTLSLYHLMIWCFEQTALFFSAKTARCTCQLLTFCGTEATLSFSPDPVCSSFSAEVCFILHALCWSWQHQQVYHFYLTRSVLLSQSFWQKLSSLSSCFIRLQWVPEYSFLPRNDAADELARRLLVPSAISRSLPLISRSSLFSDWRHTVSLKFFDTQVPSISTEKLVLPRHTRCVLSGLRCNGYSLLLSSSLGLAESRILPAAPADPRPRTPLISFCTVQLQTLRRSLFGNSLFL